MSVMGIFHQLTGQQRGLRLSDPGLTGNSKITEGAVASFRFAYHPEVITSRTETQYGTATSRHGRFHFFI
jgi:hypothetical protein